MKPEWWYPRIAGVVATLIATSWLLAVTPAWMNGPIFGTGVGLILLQVMLVAAQFDWEAP